MSKIVYAVLLSVGLVSVQSVFADETSTSTTKIDNPVDGSTVNSTTTREVVPGAEKTESTTAETSPYGQKVTSKKHYKDCLGGEKTHTETTETR